MLWLKRGLAEAASRLKPDHLAIENYRKVLAIDKKNMNARKRIEKLSKRAN